GSCSHWPMKGYDLCGDAEILAEDSLQRHRATMRLAQMPSEIAERGIVQIRPRCRQLADRILVPKQRRAHAAQVEQYLREKVDFGPLFEQEAAELLRPGQPPPMLAGRSQLMREI